MEAASSSRPSRKTCASGLFRVLQEALANVHRHAGAGRVEVVLAVAADRVTLEVRDDGRGFTCPTDLGTLIRSGHFGLAAPTSA